MNKRYITNDELQGKVQDILRQMQQDSWRPDIVVGITRGGAYPAVLISHYLNAKMVGLDVSLRDKFPGEVDVGPESNCWLAEFAQEGKNILIVDDINDSGETINWILDDWDHPRDSIKWGENVRFAVLFDNLASKATHTPTYVGEEINKAEDNIWLVFPYEIWWK